MPPKRKATKAQEKQADVAKGPSKQPKQEGQKAVSRDLNVPIDEAFYDAGKLCLYLVRNLRLAQCPAGATVYIDDEGIIFDASLNQTNIGGNNNKFYRMQLLQAQSGKGYVYYVHTRWGRVGDFGQKKTMNHGSSLDAALAEYNKKFKDKSGHKWENRNEPAKKNRYTFIERSYEDDSDDEEKKATKQENQASEDEEEIVKIESKLPEQTQRLMELIFNQEHFDSVLEYMGYNADKLPLGKLSKATLKRGFDHLSELAALIKTPGRAADKYQCSQKEAIDDFSNKYYSTIPHEFGRRRPIPISNIELLRQETSMLDTLSDMEVANAIMKGDKKKEVETVNVLDQRFHGLKMDEMTPLEHDSTEYKALAHYLVGSSASGHGVQYSLEEIFRIKRNGELDRFDSSEFSKLGESDKRLLWHGSRTTNFGGILSQGLRIAPPGAPVSGYAFGKGVYLADISSKSANYCASSLSGGTGLLLLCEAELGKPMYEIPTGNPMAEEEAKKTGCISTLGVGKTSPQGWTDGGFINEELKGVQIPDVSKGIGDNKAANANGYLMYNEYICYNVAQIRLKYLFRVKM
ncbi:MAG: hypothetical protein Q9174_005689 [Haloplaca sp. 1 TL-2023]